MAGIDSPDDLRCLTADKLEQVCTELRQYIIDVLSENPGHLGASLGTVELTVALHYVFNTPYDRIVWDVGHQAYGHKILTGRRRQFCTNRMLHGNMPAKYESLTDATFREKLVVVVLVLCLLLIGVFPGWIADMLDQSIAPMMRW